MPSTAAEVKLREQLALVIQVMQDNTVKISQSGGGFVDLATRAGIFSKSLLRSLNHVILVFR